MTYVAATPTPVQIKSEFTSDPLGLGYAALIAAQDWNGLAILLNASRVGQTINRRHVFAIELVEAIDAAAINALNVGNRDAIVFLMQAATGGEIDPFNTITRTYFNLFTGATKTRLDALLTRQGSRAEALWGEDVIITDVQCEAAAKL